MQINSIHSSDTVGRSFNGLYFTKANHVLFNNDAEYITSEVLKKTDSGLRYIEDNKIKDTLKKKFLKNKYLRNLAQDNDVFVRHIEVAPSHLSSDYSSVTKISWFDKVKQSSVEKVVRAQSSVSQNEANKKMFKKIDGKHFSIMY